jgi:hypothetical protein
MLQSHKHLDSDFDRECDAKMYEIVYLIKRPGYEFAFSLPTAPLADLSHTSPLFRLRFRKTPPEHEVVLDLKALEDFYESLTRLIEYVATERGKHPQP